jgi:macrolide transport system ATP-binding/permease protein
MPNMLQLHNLTFAYDTSYPLFENLTLSFHTGWTGIAGANGCGKSTLLKLISGQLLPQAGTVQLNTSDGSPRLLYVPQESSGAAAYQHEIDAYQDALFDGNQEAYRWLDLLEVDFDWFYRLDTLSFGERKRLQLAAALRQEPDCLCLDEPVNHLDQDARGTISHALKQYKGIGLLVSHDRYLLNELPHAVLLLNREGSVLRRGNYAKVMEEQDKENRFNQRNREKAHREVRKLEAEASKRRALAASQQKRRSKRNLDRNDSDGRAKLDLVRVSGKDGTGGKLLRQMDGRLEQAHTRLEQSRYHADKATGITIQGAKSKGDFLFRQPACSIRFGKNSEQTCLCLPALEIQPGDRIGIVGKNGSGKSTLLRRILASGRLDKETTLYLPQEFSENEKVKLHDDFERLNRSAMGDILSAVARLGSDPETVRESLSFSPGEARKIFLAMALYGTSLPKLLILDEPENHLDLPAVRFLEEALAGYPGALLLVSHDREFRKNLINRTWEIFRTEEGNTLKV